MKEASGDGASAQLQSKKEIVTLNTVWRWGLNNQLVDRPLPKAGLRMPRGVEKPSFQTWKEIERKIALLTRTDGISFAPSASPSITRCATERNALSFATTF